MKDTMHRFVLLSAKGQNAVEFALLSGIVLLALLAAIFMFSDKIAAFFAKNPVSTNPLSSKMKEMPDQTIVNDSSSTLTETICSSNSCNIVLDSLVLQNVPTDFKSVVSTTGASGGSEVIADLLGQVADTLSKDPSANTQTVATLNDLAEIGSQLAMVEKVIEDKIAACEANPTSCNSNLSVQPMQLQGNFTSDFLSNFNNQPFYELSKNLQTKETTDTCYDYQGVCYQLQQFEPNKYLMPNFKSNLDTLMASNIDSTSKETIQVLSNEIITLSDNLDKQLLNLFGLYNTSSSKGQGFNESDLASETTDLDSQLICKENNANLENGKCQ